MAKQASAGELRTLVYFRRTVKTTDSDGHPHQKKESVFGYDGQGREVPVHCKWVNVHGTEAFATMQLELKEPATLTMRYSPRIQPTMLVYKHGDPVPYEIISLNNVEDRCRWLEIKVQRRRAAQ